MTEKPFLDIKEASELTGLTKATIYRKVSQETIPAYKLGNKAIRFDRAELIEWMKQRPIGGDREPKTDQA